MSVVDVKKIVKNIKDNLKNRVILLSGKRLPKLVVILVGDNPASEKYVKGKEKDCAEVGFLTETIRLSEKIEEKALLKKVEELNEDINVDGILVQLPLPNHIDEQKVIKKIKPDKDVDGFHPLNIGNLVLGLDGFIPCTPNGVIKILEEIGLDDLSGKKVLLVGRSNIVGKPLAHLLLKKHATLTIAHSRTDNLAKELKQADIVILAVGKAKLVTGDMLKKDAILIDVGININDDGKLCGDADFDSCSKVCTFITPVPGGVGLMTRAMLLENTWQAFIKHEEINDERMEL